MDPTSVQMETMSKPCCSRLRAISPDEPAQSASYQLQLQRCAEGEKKPEDDGLKGGEIDAQKMAAFLPALWDTSRTFAIAASCSSPPN
jgi:hypothetical protein